MTAPIRRRMDRVAGDASGKRTAPRKAHSADAEQQQHVGSISCKSEHVGKAGRELEQERILIELRWRSGREMGPKIGRRFEGNKWDESSVLVLRCLMLFGCKGVRLYLHLNGFMRYYERCVIKPIKNDAKNTKMLFFFIVLSIKLIIIAWNIDVFKNLWFDLHNSHMS